MENSFHFVDGIKVDRTARRLIRSHVMRGKNAGRTIHRPSRLAIARPPPYDRKVSQPISRTLNEEEITAGREHSCPTTIARSLGNELLTFPFPLRLMPYSLKVINRYFTYVVEKMYPSQLSLSSDEVKYALLRVLCADEAASHCTIALMEACNEFFSGGTRSPATFYHLSRTFTLVRKRLKSEEAVSDSTLGIVLMLVIQEQIRNEQSEAQIHYEGLGKMIELRGGLCQLERNLPLVLKICKTDITYALQYGRPMLFFRDRMSEVQMALASRGFSHNRVLAASAICHTGLDPDLREILLDVTSLTSLINSIPADQTLDVNTFQEMVISICSRLIRFHPLLSSKGESDIEAAYHIGLTVFMMTLFLQHDGRRILRYELVSLRLKAVLDRGLDELDNDLVLWLMLIGGIWIAGDADELWLVLRISRLGRRLGINSWTEVQGSINKFPWINAIHDQPGRAVWDSAYQSYPRCHDLCF